MNRVIIKSSIKSSYQVGDIIQYDMNYRGVTPRIHEGEILSIDKGISTHGIAGDYIYKVKDTKTGKVYNVDEAAIC